MKKSLSLITAVVLIMAMTSVSMLSCSSPEQKKLEGIAEIKRGDIQVTVSSDGNLTMPHQVKLRFGTPGTVKNILVEEGDIVKAGTLLAKLDNTTQKLAVASALYDIELALNELAERVYPSILGYPHYYPSTSVVLRVKQAQEELQRTGELLEQNKQKDAASELHIAQYDLEASLDTLKTALKSTISSLLENESSSVNRLSSENIQDLINLIEQDLATLASVQNSIEKADYVNAISKLAKAQQNIETTYSVAQKVCGQVLILGISYPDTSTSFDSLTAVENNLKEIQNLMETDDYDKAKVGEILRIVQHDLEISQQILEENDLILKHGVNLKVLRQNNLTLQKYEIALQQYKEELRKTEILAPFDGTVVYIGVKEDDQLSAYDYSTITAIYLVDTKSVELDGVVDEIDIFKVKLGQKATITVDALPDQKLTGIITFISPFGTGEMGVVNYKVTIKLDPTEVELKGGLTATANIIVDNMENVLVIPNDAIKGTHGDYWTQVLIGGTKNEIEKRQITLGLQNELFSEVVSGLKEGEKVIVEKTTANTRSIFK